VAAEKKKKKKKAVTTEGAHDVAGWKQKSSVLRVKGREGIKSFPRSDAIRDARGKKRKGGFFPQEDRQRPVRGKTRKEGDRPGVTRGEEGREGEKSSYLGRKRRQEFLAEKGKRPLQKRRKSLLAAAEKKGASHQQ